jgi:hypothetical protein
VVLWRHIEILWDAVYLTVVGIKLLKLNSLRVILVDELEDVSHLFLGKRAVKSLQNLTELIQTQLAASIGIVGHECPVKSELFKG